jgi:chromosomal replication initiation ATPase DnaA
MDHSRNNAINDFIHFYQLIDVLIIDDVQFFAKAEKSQDAFLPFSITCTNPANNWYLLPINHQKIWKVYRKDYSAVFAGA